MMKNRGEINEMEMNDTKNKWKQKLISWKVKQNWQTLSQTDQNKTEKTRMNTISDEKRDFYRSQWNPGDYLDTLWKFTS